MSRRSRCTFFWVYQTHFVPVPTGQKLSLCKISGALQLLKLAPRIFDGRIVDRISLISFSVHDRTGGTHHLSTTLFFQASQPFLGPLTALPCPVLHLASRSASRLSPPRCKIASRALSVNDKKQMLEKNCLCYGPHKPGEHGSMSHLFAQRRLDLVHVRMHFDPTHLRQLARSFTSLPARGHSLLDVHTSMC